MHKALKTALAAAGLTSIGIVVYSQLTRRKFSGLKMKRSIIIDRPAAELYRFWRDFSNLPQLIDALESVQTLDRNRSRWTISTPGGIHVSWDAEITADRQNEMIGWRSVENSPIETAGYVKFIEAPGGQGTMVQVALEYQPPAGRVGAGIAAILGRKPGVLVEEALDRFKQLFEADGMGLPQLIVKIR